METGPLTPCAHDVILGNRKDDVAIGVVFDLRERTLVSREKNGPHVCDVYVEVGWCDGLYVAGGVSKFG